MIVLINWQTFHLRYYNNSRIYVKESEDYWEFYTQDGVMIIKAVVERSENAEDNIAFTERFLQNREDVIKVMDVWDSNLPVAEEDATEPESDAAVMEEKESEDLSGGRTSYDDDHDHAYLIDEYGNGKTTDTIPRDHPAHVHNINRGYVQEVNGHTHLVDLYGDIPDIETEEEGDEEKM